MCLLVHVPVPEFLLYACMSVRLCAHLPVCLCNARVPAICPSILQLSLQIRLSILQVYLRIGPYGAYVEMAPSSKKKRPMRAPLHEVRREGTGWLSE